MFPASSTEETVLDNNGNINKENNLTKPVDKNDAAQEKQSEREKRKRTAKQDIAVTTGLLRIRIVYKCVRGLGQHELYIYIYINIYIYLYIYINTDVYTYLASERPRGLCLS